MEHILNYRWLNFKTNLVQLCLTVSFCFFCLWIFLEMQFCWLRTGGKFHMIDEWLGNHLDFPSTEITLESIKGSPHLLKKSMDLKFYIRTSVMQYYDTNIIFSVGRTCPFDKTLTDCIYGDCVSLKMYSYLTIFQWGYLAGIL